MSSAAAESSRSTWSGESPGHAAAAAAAAVPSFAVMLARRDESESLMAGNGWGGF